MKTEIFPPLGSEYCKTGSLCSLEVSITRLVDLSEVDRDEALTESDGYCTTKLMYEGKTTFLKDIDEIPQFCLDNNICQTFLWHIFLYCEYSCSVKQFSFC